jgi:hypothetical protein
VLDDPLGVADHLAVEDQHRNPTLAAECLDLGAPRAALTDRLRLKCDAVPAQRASDASARAQPIRGSAAPVEDGHIAHDR